MYVEDAAEALIQALELYEDNSQPLNIGCNEETSIKELVDVIVNVVQYEGEVRWLVEKGDGQMRKLLDTSRMRDILKVELTPFRAGIENTVKWYTKNKELADKGK
jgi:GDP-L-fucose synthase